MSDESLILRILWTLLNFVGPKTLISHPSSISQCRNIYTNERLLCYHFEVNLSCVAITEIDRGFVSAELFHFFRNCDLAAINLVTFLLADSPANLERGNAAEDLSAGTGLCAEFQRTFLQFSNYAVHLCEHLLFFLPYLLQSFFRLLAVTWAALNCKLAWQ